MVHPFELTIAPSDGAANIYLEVAAGVTTFIIAGRYFEARSKRRAGAALRVLLELDAKDVTVIGANTQLAQMAKAVEDAENGKAAVRRLADRISGVFVPIVIALAAATLGFWLGTGVGAAAAAEAPGNGSARCPTSGSSPTPRGSGCRASSTATRCSSGGCVDHP
jgi:cation transport ATPase